MITINAKIPKFEIDLKKFENSLDNLIEKLIYEAARRWWTIVWNDLPVDSGESIGSLYNLGLQLGLSPGSGGKGPRTGSGLKPYPRREKSFQKGIGESDFFIGKLGTGHWQFRWQSSVLQIEMNTQFFGLREKMQNTYQRLYAQRKGPYLKRETPWMIITKANYEFILYVQDKLTECLPKVSEFIKVTYATV